MRSHHLYLGALLALALQGPASAADAGPPADKGGYTLFNPTPPSLLREFNTDRPDITESPLTVDAGHFQTETDIVNYTRSPRDRDGTRTEKYLFGSTNLRVGLTNNAEFDLLVQPFNAVRTTMLDPPTTTWKSGPDILQARLKLNLYGNDTYKEPGSIALGLLPFINIPTVRNGAGSRYFEGGLAVPFAIKLTDKADLGLMTQVEAIRNEVGRGYHFEYLNTASVSYELTDKLGAYGEVAARFGKQGGPGGAAVTLGTGLLFRVAHDVQVDVGVNVGITKAADRINPFVGISKRF